tara:strand:- start:89951 stop:90730 length:780 start_codon:yes stop_codon:yes gene_type:complete
VTSGNGDSNLYEVDDTGATIGTIGDTGEFFTGLAYDRNRGLLVGTTSPNSATPSSVFEINPDTGAATLVGAHGVDQAVIDLTFAEDGTLYGWLEPGSDDLVTIDLGTGAATVLGNGPSSGGRTIEFVPSGEVALFNLSLATLLDPVTGLATGDTIALSGSGSINASFRTSTGLVYAIGAQGGQGGLRTLNTIDFETGVVTELGEISVLNASGLASDLFDPTQNPDDPTFAAASIPAVPLFGLLALGGLLALLGLGRLKF